MANRTYLIEMNRLTYKLYKYLTRYRDKYYPDMDTDQAQQVNVLQDALEAFLPLIPLPEPTSDKS
jgi:hypothetical protein